MSKTPRASSCASGPIFPQASAKSFRHQPCFHCTRVSATLIFLRRPCPRRDARANSPTHGPALSSPIPGATLLRTRPTHARNWHCGIRLGVCRCSMIAVPAPDTWQSPAWATSTDMHTPTDFDLRAVRKVRLICGRLASPCATMHAHDLHFKIAPRAELRWGTHVVLFIEAPAAESIRSRLQMAGNRTNPATLSNAGREHAQ